MTELSFLFNFFVLPYVVQRLLKRPNGIAYSALFLLATTLVMTYIDIYAINQSIYSTVGVRVDATPHQIKVAFRKASFHAHPDRNQAEDASSIQAQLNYWKEILENPKTRDIYDRFGPETADWVMKQSANQPIDSDRLPTFAQVSFGFYLTWFVLTYLLCLGKDCANGRSISYLMLTCFAFTEWMMLGTPFSPPVNFMVDWLPYTPTYIQIRFIHTLYPIAMNAARLFSMATFVDQEAINQALMVAILRSNEAILNTVQQLQASHEALRNSGPAGEEVDDGTGLGAMPVAARLKKEQTKMRALQAQAEASSGRSFPSWLVPIGLMFLANYLQSSPAPAPQPKAK